MIAGGTALAASPQNPSVGDVNQVSLVGTIADDPRLFEGRSPVLKLRVSTAESFGSRSYQNTHSVVCFGDLTKLSLALGERLAIEGRLQNGSYINKQNVKVFTVDVVANKVTRIGEAS